MDSPLLPPRGRRRTSQSSQVIDDHVKLKEQLLRISKVERNERYTIEADLMLSVPAIHHPRPRPPPVPSRRASRHTSRRTGCARPPRL